jgi:hypothetical protein
MGGEVGGGIEGCEAEPIEKRPVPLGVDGPRVGISDVTAAREGASGVGFLCHRSTCRGLHRRNGGVSEDSAHQTVRGVGISGGW